MSCFFCGGMGLVNEPMVRWSAKHVTTSNEMRRSRGDEGKARTIPPDARNKTIPILKIETSRMVPT